MATENVLRLHASNCEYCPTADFKTLAQKSLSLLAIFNLIGWHPWNEP